MTKKILCVIAVTIMSLGICFGCADNAPLPYNAMVVDGGIVADKIDMIPQIGCFTDEFWKENTIGGLLYKNKNWDPNDAESEEYIYDKISPQVRMHTVTNQEEYYRVFSEPMEIDFEKEMILIHIWREDDKSITKIKDIKVENEKLILEFSSKNSDSCAQPNYMCCYTVFKMDKLEVTSLAFYLNGNNWSAMFGEGSSWSDYYL